jgi:hypothetical protein
VTRCGLKDSQIDPAGPASGSSAPVCRISAVSRKYCFCNQKRSAKIINYMFNIDEKMKNSPHVVLLGAGASYACIPNGDKNGRKISCMDNFFENTSIDIGYTGSFKNLEDIYQDIDNTNRDLLEKEIWKYFNKFELPEFPTIYDVLIISLTQKDIIASFNWDPLIVQAYQRCHNITQDLPDIVFLHGNVREWYAIEDDGIMTKVFAPSECPSHRAYVKTASGKRCAPSPLLYPIRNKDYAKCIYIKKSWDTLRNKLNESFMVTIFGYSGPRSDEEALRLLKDGFLIKSENGNINDINNYKQLTIIDRNENILDSFRNLLYIPQVPFTEGIENYVKVLDDFWSEDNWLITWPRLTTEAYTITQYEMKFSEKWPITIDQNNLTWDKIKSIAKNQINKNDICILSTGIRRIDP